MERFFNANRVAVIGVSSRPGNLGQRIIRNLLNFQFKGEIIPVGPRGGSFHGFAIHKNILDVRRNIDLAVILTPAVTIPPIVEQCGQKGIKRVVIESGGFGELDEQGRRLSEQVLSIAAKYGMRIIGPNGIGVANRHRGLAVSFASLPKPVPGGISVIAQSGGVGINYCNEFISENLGLAKFSSIGNKIDVNEADLIEYLGNDPKTKIILAYLESIVDGRRLFKVATRCKKPVVIHKSNIGATSHKIAASHSSAIMTDDKVADAMFEQAGIIRSASLSQTVAAAKAFTLPALKGRRLAIVSRSGGDAVIAADQCHLQNLILPDLDPKLLREVRDHVRAGVIKLQNPLDLGDLFDMEFYQLIMDKIIAQKNIDGIVFLFTYYSNFDPHVPQRVIDYLTTLCKKHKKPVAMVLSSWATEVRRLKEYSEFPIFNSAGEAVWALAQTFKHFHGSKKKNRRARRPAKLHKSQGESYFSRCPKSRSVLNAQAYTLLDLYGISSPKRKLVTDSAKAVVAAKKIGFPVVMKVEGEKLTHKSDIGGVELNVTSATQVKNIVKKWKQIFGSKLQGVLVQGGQSGGIELILGAKRDPVFGPVIMLGWGGVLAELFDRQVIRLAPVTKTEAMEMIESLPGKKTLEGYRHNPKVSKEAIARTIVRFGWMIADNSRITEADINPLCATKEGAVALDVRIFLDESSAKK